MRFWDRLKMVLRGAGFNGWLESQDERLRRLEETTEAQRRYAEALRRYEEGKLGRGFG